MEIVLNVLSDGRIQLVEFNHSTGLTRQLQTYHPSCHVFGFNQD